jgi:glycosyltransferase involved in cell wall biosynthesis
MAPLRIAFINPCGNIGGAERALLLLLRGLDRARYAPTVVCPAPGRLLDALAEIDVPAEVVPLGGLERLSRFTAGWSWREELAGAGGMAAAALALARRLHRLRPDILHTNGMKAHLAGGLCGRLLGLPVIWHMRDLVPDGRQLGLFRAAAGALPRRVITVSGAVTALLEGCRAGKAARTVHDAVDLSRVVATRDAGMVRQELGLPPNAVVLAMVAHFARWKGHLLFLDVMARLAARGLPVAGLVVGSSIYQGGAGGDYEAEVRARCAELGLEDRVRFTGFQDRVADLLNAADLLVHPPLQPEPFGLGVVEAMALRKPVVGAAAGGLLETVEPDVTGLLVPPGDAAAFAGAIERLVHDPARRAAMGERGRARVLDLFQPEAHVARVEGVYQEVLRVA